MGVVIPYGPLVGCWYFLQLLNGCVDGCSYFLEAMEMRMPRELKATPRKMASGLKYRGML
jgi:hypothetical protein